MQIFFIIFHLSRFAPEMCECRSKVPSPFCTIGMLLYIVLEKIVDNFWADVFYVSFCDCSVSKDMVYFKKSTLKTPSSCCQKFDSECSKSTFYIQLALYDNYKHLNYIKLMS